MSFFPDFDDDDYVNIIPWVDREDHLRVTIRGLENTPYEGGIFVFEIKIPSNYPYSPPYCFCQTLIWHPNIDPSAMSSPGRSNICIPLLNPALVGKVDKKTGASGWTPSKTLTNLIEALKGVIHMLPPNWNPNDSLNKEAGQMYLKNPLAFDVKAREWTERYALR